MDINKTESNPFGADNDFDIKNNNLDVNIKLINKSFESSLKRDRNPVKYMNQMSDKMVVYNDMESRVAFKCNVEQELKDLWELVSKTWYVKDSDSTVIYRAPRMDDTILFYLQRTVERKPFVWRSEIVRYPPRGAPNLKNINITGVAIIDSKRTGMGGEASILNGGIGFDFVDIKLQSNWFCGYSFTIVIIGKYMDTDSEVNSVYQRFTDITND